MNSKTCLMLAALTAMLTFTRAARAADYYVATTGSDDNDGLSAEAPFATVDKAISSATSTSDNIYVAAGTYSTTTQWGPNLKARLVGTGATRDDVVIESSGAYRTLRMDANSWLEKVTVVGCTDISKADKGGAIEMNGGTVTNCVIRNGTAYGNDNKNAGGNLYVSSSGALVIDCAISGGTAKNHGGNVCLDYGTLRNCTITGGTASGGSENNGGNVWTYQGTIEDCTISGGSAVLGGNVYLHNANASLTGGTITNGVATQYGGNVYLREGSMLNAAVLGGSTTTTSGNYGGGNVYADGNAVVTNCVILDGSAYRRGGNVYALGGATIADCAISNGVCSANIGGNIYIEAATVTNSTVYGGSAPAGRGGNIFLNNAASLVTDCTIENGNAGTQGGNVFLNGGAVSCSVVVNGTATQQGGNVYIENTSASCADCTIQGGNASSGGNVFNKGRLIRCSITGGNCSSTNMGGGVRNNGSSALLEDCLIANNANGGLLQEGSAKVYSCTIVGNTGTGVYGYGSGSKSTIWFNTIIYGNTGDSDSDVRPWRGDQPTLMTNCAIDSSDMAGNANYANCVYLGDSGAFADYAGGDYRPTAGSSLVDAGATDPRGAEASPTDLDGNPRLNGVIDIGCYEYQKPEMVVHIDSATPDQNFAPMTVTFTHSADNSASPENVVFAYDFGDGATAENIMAGTVSHTYATPGAYTVKITATNSCDEESAEMTYPGYVRAASPTVYVTPGTGSGTFPYNTPESGFASLKSAVDNVIDGNTLVLGSGVYETSNEIVVNKAITILGTGAKPEDVIVRNTVASQGHRTMAVNNAGALVANVTIENGYVQNLFGGNLRIAAGVVSNCVIRGGTVVADGNNGAGAGVSIEGSDGTSVLSHCVVSNNVVSGTSKEDAYAGGAVFFPYGSRGKMYNTLVAFNTYTPSVDDKRGAAGIRFGGGNEQAVVENCTVAANVVDGKITSSSAGAFCNSWSTTVRNTVFAGNYESGDDRYTSVNFESHMNVINCVMDDVAFNQYCTVGKVDDMFKDFEAGDFAPKVGGLLYNKGTNPSVLPAVDLAGSPRVFGKAIDIGCYECQVRPGLAVIVR